MMREAIEAWEAEGGGLREITEGAAAPSVVVYRRRPVSSEKRMICTANQVDWAERIKEQVSQEGADPVAWEMMHDGQQFPAASD